MTPHQHQSNSQELLARLLRIPKFGTGIGLHRMSWILKKIQEAHPGCTFDAIKITGSNGKGSVCALLNAILTSCRVSHGLYTSPHLIRFHERIMINDEEISDQDLQAAIVWNEAMCHEYQAEFSDDQFGAFEVFTGIALYHFARRHLTTLILEAGIGGRYDSIRVVPGKLAALTSLDLEHTGVLGATLEEIAYHKIDLCPDGGTLVSGRIPDPDLLRRIRAYCELKRINLIMTQHTCHAENIRYADDAMILDLKWQEGWFHNLRLHLVGAHQISNVSVAIHLAWEWCKTNLPGYSLEDFEHSVRQGCLNVTWPGRFEKIHAAPDVYIDAAHSLDAIHALLKTIHAVLPNQKILLVTGVSSNKQVEDIVTSLAPIAAEVICTRAYHRGADVLRIEQAFRAACPHTPSHRADTIETAMCLAIERARQANMTVIVAGGLFLAIEARHTLQGHDPQHLTFF